MSAVLGGMGSGGVVETKGTGKIWVYCNNPSQRHYGEIKQKPFSEVLLVIKGDTDLT